MKKKFLHRRHFIIYFSNVYQKVYIKHGKRLICMLHKMLHNICPMIYMKHIQVHKNINFLGAKT